MDYFKQIIILVLLASPSLQANIPAPGEQANIPASGEQTNIPVAVEKANILAAGEQANIPAPGEQLANIAALEKEQSELYQQISDAIDDSVKTLHNSNDSDIQQGLQYILELKQHINSLNGSNDTSSEGGEAGVDARKYDFQNFEKNNDFIDKLFKDRNKSKKKLEAWKNREAMDKRVAAWIKAKEEEKQRIKLYKSKKRQAFSMKEKCPRHGKKKMNRYPCCRKCCKKSVLGCL